MEMSSVLFTNLRTGGIASGSDHSGGKSGLCQVSTSHGDDNDGCVMLLTE